MKITYEKQTCTRCGGSGSYSFNLRHGTMCYGCNGTGKQLSPNGKRALKRMKEFKAEHYNKLATDLEVGDAINQNDGCYRKVLSVSEDGNYSTTIRDGVKEKHYYVKVETKNVTYCIHTTSTVEVRPTQEQFRNEMVPFAKRFKGATINCEDKS